MHWNQSIAPRRDRAASVARIDSWGGSRKRKRAPEIPEGGPCIRRTLTVKTAGGEPRTHELTSKLRRRVGETATPVHFLCDATRFGNEGTRAVEVILTCRKQTLSLGVKVSPIWLNG